jgi:hypothetical protein
MKFPFVRRSTLHRLQQQHAKELERIRLNHHDEIAELHEELRGEAGYVAPFKFNWPEDQAVVTITVSLSALKDDLGGELYRISRNLRRRLRRLFSTLTPKQATLVAPIDSPERPRQWHNRLHDEVADWARREVKKNKRRRETET